MNLLNRPSSPKRRFTLESSEIMSKGIKRAEKEIVAIRSSQFCRYALFDQPKGEKIGQRVACSNQCERKLATLPTRRAAAFEGIFLNVGTSTLFISSKFVYFSSLPSIHVSSLHFHLIEINYVPWLPFSDYRNVGLPVGYFFAVWSSRTRFQLFQRAEGVACVPANQRSTRSEREHVSLFHSVKRILGASLDFR